MGKTDDIRLLADEFEKYYLTLTGIQKEWKTYYDDEFETSIKKPYHEIRTGSGARIVDTIANHVTTANIQIDRELRKKTDTEKDSKRRIISLLTHLVYVWKDSIDDAVQNAPLYGEGFLQPQYDPGNKDMPISISAPNPLTIFPDPHEVLGIPKKVFKKCEMTVGAIQSLYPDWRGGDLMESTEKVPYLAYWDDDIRYIEANESTCIKGGVHKNIFKAPPFVHFPSGFGKSSPESKPEERYVSVLHKAMSKLKEECEVESRIDSATALYVNPILVLQPTIESAVPPEEDSIVLAPGRTVTLDWGWDYEIRQGDPPPPEMFHHLARIKADIGLEIPPVMMGVPSTAGASGRQEDIYASHFQKKPNKIKGNAERALATTLGLVLKILDTVPGALPITVQTLQHVDGVDVRKEEKLTKDDIDGYYDVSVEFKPDVEAEQAQKLMMYRALYDSPSGPKVSWKTLLVEGLGWSEERAEEEIDESLVDTAMRTNPLLANIAVEEAMRELGLERQLAELKKAGQPLLPSGLSPMPGGQQRAFTGSPESKDTVRQMFAPEAGGQVRNPPAQTGG